MQRHTAFEQSVKLSDNPPNHLYQIPSPTAAACVYGIGNMLRQERNVNIYFFSQSMDGFALTNLGFSSYTHTY